jgi:hypothetical protein
MHEAPHTDAGRYIPFKRGGWGVALFISLLAVGSALAAGYVHKRTYKDPTDVRFRAVGESGAHR